MRFTFTITETQHASLEAIRAARGLRSMADVLRTMVEEHIRENTPAPADRWLDDDIPLD